MLVLLLLLLLIKHNYAFETNVGGNRVFRYNKFMDACLNETSLVNYTFKLISDPTKLLIFNVDAYLRKNFETAMFSVSFERCASKESLDTCNVLRVLKTDRFCNFISSKKKIWTPLINCIKPQIHCPIKKGSYTGTNCSLDIKLFNYLPLGRAYWKFRVKLFLPTGENVICADFAGQKVKG